MLPDQASDVPKIANYFAHTLYALLKNEAFELKDIVWTGFTDAGAKNVDAEAEEDMPFVETYYKTVAELLVLW